MADRRTVLVPQALGADQFLRVTWHDGRRLMVVSHWEGDRCVAATPVRVDQLGELAELVVTAFARSTPPPAAAWAGAWPAPSAGDVWVPAAAPGLAPDLAPVGGSSLFDAWAVRPA